MALAESVGKIFGASPSENSKLRFRPEGAFGYSPDVLETLHRYVVQEGFLNCNDPPAATSNQLANIDELRKTAREKHDQIMEDDDPSEQLKHDYYLALCAVTAPINGTTLSDSRRPLRKHKSFYVTGFLILVLALSNQILSGYCEVSDEWRPICLQLQPYVLEILEPFLWGAIGSYIYLLQRAYMRAARFSFNSNRFTGWDTRVALGGILGGIVQHTVDPSFLNETGFNTVAVAFFVGIAAKPIYDVYEQAAYTFSEFLKSKLIGSKDPSNGANGQATQPETDSKPSAEEAITSESDSSAPKPQS